MSLAEEVKKLADEAKLVVSKAGLSKQALEEHKKVFLGKEGKLKLALGRLKELSPEDKPKVALELNQLKSLLEKFFEEEEDKINSQEENKKLASEFYDLSLPSNGSGRGQVHPITQVERKIAEVLRQYGFENVIGPEIDTEYYCFDALNFPPEHPARDIMDTFYTDTSKDKTVNMMRTHMTALSARSLEGAPLPIKVAAFGRVYRNETEDATHQSMFHQFDMVWIEKGLTTSDLMGICSHIVKELYGQKRKVNFVPKFYPYTEPSLGLRIDCTLCNGEGCSSCGGSGWVTVAGAGMLHRNVLKEFKYNPDEVGGIAFGLGTSRLAAQFFNFENLRTLYENDLRLLQQL